MYIWSARIGSTVILAANVLVLRSKGIPLSTQRKVIKLLSTLPAVFVFSLEENIHFTYFFSAFFSIRFVVSKYSVISLEINSSHCSAFSFPQANRLCRAKKNNTISKRKLYLEVTGSNFIQNRRRTIFAKKKRNSSEFVLILGSSVADFSRVSENDNIVVNTNIK